MSASNRATSAELAAEFERAMGSLAERPILSTDQDAWLAAIDLLSSLGASSDANDAAEYFTRIAAIALEGAARLRRGT